MALDWGKPVFVLKLAITKAFGSATRARLGQIIFRRIVVGGGMLYLWSESLEFLQSQVQRVETVVEGEGLRINKKEDRVSALTRCKAKLSKLEVIKYPTLQIKVQGRTSAWVL